MDLYLSDERYLAALYRQRDRIIAGTPLVTEDSDTIGNKYTQATWGLCSKERDAWPDRDDHLWPDQFDTGRVAPKYRRDRQVCPMQNKGGPQGCFYSCAIFQGGLKSREKAIARYEATIGKARKHDTEQSA